jgi:glycosyltransferase involved in cell wall biosynthesis
MKVLYFAVEKADYPRNARIRGFLRDHGAAVTVLMRPQHRSKLREYLALLQVGLRHRSGYDLVILSEFSTNLFPISWLISRLNGGVHAVDFFVGKHETIVEDWQKVNSKHLLARVLLFLDRAALRSADVAFADTAVRARVFTGLVSGVTPVVNLPVGAPDWARNTVSPPGKAIDAPLEVLYYGHYIALHGVDVLLDGVLRAGQVIPIRATFIGEGTSKEEMVSKVSRLGLSDQIEFVGYQPPRALMQHIARCDVVLGIFGVSPKAGSVIANKVWQGLYAGRIVITRRSEALAEIEGIAGTRLVQVEPGDSAAISDGLIQIYFGRTEAEFAPSRPMAEMLEEYVTRQFDIAFAHPVLHRASRHLTTTQQS